MCSEVLCCVGVCGAPCFVVVSCRVVLFRLVFVLFGCACSVLILRDLFRVVLCCGWMLCVLLCCVALPCGVLWCMLLRVVVCCFGSDTGVGFVVCSCLVSRCGWRVQRCVVLFPGVCVRVCWFYVVF